MGYGISFRRRILLMISCALIGLFVSLSLIAIGLLLGWVVDRATTLDVLGFLELLAVMATLIAFTFTFVGMVVLIYQVREARRLRKLQATVMFTDILGSDETRLIRRYIHHKLPMVAGNLSNDTDTLVILEKLCNTYENVALMVNEGIVHRRLLLELYAGAYIRDWELLRPYVENLRQIRGNPYMENFEILAQDAMEWWKRRWPGEPLPQAHRLYSLEDSQANMELEIMKKNITRKLSLDC